jgi:polyisoprenoid-binding protein YceI
MNIVVSRAVRVVALGAIVALMVSALPASAATYEVDGVHSSAIFQVKHFGVSNFYGAFKEISGTVNYDAESADGLAVEVTIGAASVDSRYGQRDDHIKSPDFLNAAEFPAITFKSTSVTPAGDGVYSVTGDLTLHGVTNEIQVTATKTGEGKHPRSGKDLVGFETRFTIDRTEFGMSFMDGPLSAEVEFLLSLEAGK